MLVCDIFSAGTNVVRIIFQYVVFQSVDYVSSRRDAPWLDTPASSYLMTYDTVVPSASTSSRFLLLLSRGMPPRDITNRRSGGLIAHTSPHTECRRVIHAIANSNKRSEEWRRQAGGGRLTTRGMRKNLQACQQHTSEQHTEDIT